MKSRIIAFTMAGLMASAITTYPVVSAVANTVKIQTATEKANDWLAFKKEQEDKIKKNDERIADLRKARAKDDKVMDNAYTHEIDRLEKRNTELRIRLANYKYDESKWAQFKREFNHDVDELGKSLKDIGKDNVK